MLLQYNPRRKFYYYQIDFLLDGKEHKHLELRRLFAEKTTDNHHHYIAKACGTSPNANQKGCYLPEFSLLTRYQWAIPGLAVIRADNKSAR